MISLKPKVALIALLSCSLSACGAPSPSAKVEEWAITRKQDGSGYDVKLRGTVWGDGSWFTHVTFTDHNGCTKLESLGGIFPEDGEASVDKVFALPSKAKIQKLTLSLEYVAKGGDTMNPASYRKLFAEERTIDPLPAGTSSPTCKPDKATPETSFGQRSREENAATMINMAGYLCGRVLEAYPVGNGRIIVRCTIYRSGQGRAKYSIDTNAAEVRRID